VLKFFAVRCEKQTKTGPAKVLTVRPVTCDWRTGAPEHRRTGAPVTTGVTMFDKMKELMEMQRKMQEMKRQLDNTTFEIASSDGLVKITMNGSQEVQGISIQGSLPEKEKASLEKAIKEAYNKAIKRSHDIAAEKMKGITGLNLPGLF